MGLLTSIFYAVVGCAALVGGGEFLVRGATKIAFALKIPALIVGLTIVAVCTSAPEMAVSFSAALRSTGENAANVADVAIGNVVGSNICNILLILGVCALIRPLKTTRQTVFRECPIMIIVSILVFAIAFFSRTADGASVFPRWSGFLLLFGFVFYEIWTVRQARRGDANEEMRAETASESEAPKPTSVQLALATGAIIFGLALLVGGSKLFVDGAVSIAQACGVSELVIGLTLVAIGTSLPELTVSALATVRGETDVAIGNVVGSNICNILLILGGSAELVSGGLPVKAQTLWVDVPVMCATAALAGWFCFTGRKLSRWEGGVLVAAQLLYAIYLVKFAG